MEVTARTIQGRFLLNPGQGWNETFIGVLARARELYPVRIHGFVCMSNHLHLLLTPRNAHELASFMGHVLTNVSKEAARRHGWRGPLFERRYQAIVVTNEEAAQVGRLRYLLAHGVKEDLVETVEQWPGPHCAKNLRAGKPASGVWLSREGYWKAHRRGEVMKQDTCSVAYELSLDPLPCWSSLSHAMYRRRIVEILMAIEEEAKGRRVRERLGTLGVEAILKQEPLDRPSTVARRPAPRVHAASRRMRRSFLALYADFLVAFYGATERFRHSLPDARFPPGAFLPARAVAGFG